MPCSAFTSPARFSSEASVLKFPAAAAVWTMFVSGAFVVVCAAAPAVSAESATAVTAAMVRMVRICRMSTPR